MEQSTKDKISRALKGRKHPKTCRGPCHGGRKRSIGDVHARATSDGLKRYWATHYKNTRRRLIEARGEKCERCGWAERRDDGHIPVQVDHKNGDRADERDENLQLLCPNCHSLTPNFMFYGRRHNQGVAQ